MHTDPIVEEVQTIKRMVAEETDFDIDKRYEALKELEKQYAERLVASPVEPAPKKAVRL